MPKENVYYFKTFLEEDNVARYHNMEAILQREGFTPLGAQGNISRAVESLSKEVMALPPRRRKYITEGIMLLFQGYAGGENRDLLSDLWQLIN